MIFLLPLMNRIDGNEGSGEPVPDASVKRLENQ